MNKVIKWRDEIAMLFPETTERTLLENHRWCDKCNGLGLIKEGRNIRVCVVCSGKGQISLCANGCGKEKFRHYTVCEECHDKAESLRRAQMEKERFNKAEKVAYSDYQGKFLVDDQVMDKDDLEEYLFCRLEDEQEVPTYLFATTKESVLDINIREVIQDKCEDGYEDMDTYLNWDGLDEIQAAIDKWVEKQGEFNYCYSEDFKVVVLLDGVLSELRHELKNKI